MNDKARVNRGDEVLFNFRVNICWLAIKFYCSERFNDQRAVDKKVMKGT